MAMSREERLAYYKEWRSKNTEKNRAYDRKRGAEERRLRFSETTAATLRKQIITLYRCRGRPEYITKELFMQLWDEHVEKHGFRCAVTGKAFDMSHKDTRPSVDQIIPSAGYWPENIRFVTWRCNNMRGNLPDATFLELCKAVVDNNPF